MIQSIQNLYQNVESYFLPTVTEPKFTRGEGYWTNPSQEKALGYFEKLTDKNSQRENWYQVTPYIAEFWCTVSNIAIIYAGVMSGRPELVFAGTASTISHAIPKQWLLHVDKLGANLVVLRALSEYKALYSNPLLALPLVGALSVGLADVILARTKGMTSPHVVWHVASGLLTGYFFMEAAKLR